MNTNKNRLLSTLLFTLVFSASAPALDALKQPATPTALDAPGFDPLSLRTIKPALDIPLDELTSAQRWCQRALDALAARAAASGAARAGDVTVFGGSGQYSCQTVIEQLRTKGFGYSD